MFRVAICTLIFFLAAEHANSAAISVRFSTESDVATVTIDGDIAANDERKFQQHVSAISKALVVFQSEGGNALAALQIGRLIRLRSFATLVPNNTRCTSACALAWLGGATRFMGATAQIGFHAVYNVNTGNETGADNALVGAY